MNHESQFKNFEVDPALMLIQTRVAIDAACTIAADCGVDQFAYIVRCVVVVVHLVFGENACD